VSYSAEEPENLAGSREHRRMSEIFRLERPAGGPGGVYRWRKLKKRDAAAPEALLRKRETLCVAACGKFLKRNPVWTLRNKTGHVAALIVQSRQNLMPVLCGQRDFPLPRFLSGFFTSAQVHSVQGLREEIAVFERALTRLGLWVDEYIDFDLMCIDRQPNSYCLSAGPSKLIIRRPDFTDLDALAALQAGYEREEVLPRSSVFSPAASRANTERILSDQQVLAAELNGRLVGKINTSAISFTRFQIGGVYVDPGYRGRGIACRMTAEFVGSLIDQGKGVSLFVKKANPSAHSVYARLGFKTLGDYRINYY
jgi:ribosomal protein S18 acetylase RimI-like enzyme